MSNELITADMFKQVAVLDDTLRDTKQQVIDAAAGGNEMLKAITLARGMSQIRKHIDPLMPALMELMGSPLGFITDKDRPRYDKEKKQWDNSKYTAPEIRDALVVGLLRGFRPVGKEMCVISAGFYATKEGMKRVLLEFPGMNNLRIELGVPVNKGETGALVPAKVSWTLNDKPDCLICREGKNPDGTIDDTRIPVRVNSGMGVDAIRGKAESKIYRMVYAIVSGANVGVVSEEDLSDLSDPEALEHIPPTDPLDEFRHGIAAAEKPGDARVLYDAWFGPDATRDFSPEQNDEAARLTTDRETELWNAHREAKQLQKAK